MSIGILNKISNMEGTGMSLFKGAESIHVNNNEQEKLDEIEELEDQKRRTAELQNNLVNAFDDLEESFGNSTGNYTMAPHHNSNPKEHPEQQMYSTPHTRGFTAPNPQYLTPTNTCPNSAGAGDGHNYIHQEYPAQMNGLTSNMYDARNHSPILMGRENFVHNIEIQYKKQLNEALEKQNEEMEALRARLSAAVIDREKTELSLQQAQHLLASSKHSIEDLELQLVKKDELLKKADNDIKKLNLELHSATNAIHLAQQKLQSQAISQTHSADALFREQQERHRLEIDRLQEDLQKAEHRLEEKNKEAMLYERRWKDSEKEKEKLQEKTVNLRTAQEQTKLLMVKLKTVSEELKETRDKLAFTKNEYDEWRTSLQNILHDALPATYLGSPSSSGRLSILEDILSRYKQQIKKLEEELGERDKKIELNRKQVSELQSKIEEHKGEELQLKSKVAMLENKLNLLDTENDEQTIDNYKKQIEHLQNKVDEVNALNKSLELKYAELEMENERLKSDKCDRINKQQNINTELLKELEKFNARIKEKCEENAELKKLYFDVCRARDSKDREIKELDSKLKSYQKEKEGFTSKELELQDMLERERQQVAKMTTDYVVKKEELSMANQRISELQKECSEKQKEFTDKLNRYIEEERKLVRTELEICSQCEQYMKKIKSLEEDLNQLQVQIATQESNNELMQELKMNAEYFQNYILENYQKLQKVTVGTNTEDPTKVVEQPTVLNGNGIEINDHREDEFCARTNLMLKEKEIRDQIAEKFTLEIKTIEMKCSKKLKEMENEQICNINKLKQLLDRKVDEVETLKQFILSERSKITEILNAKESEISMLIKDNNSMQEEFQQFREKMAETQNILDRAQAKISKLKIEFEKKNLELGCEKEKFNRNRTEMMQKLQVVEAKNAQLDAQLLLLREKYKSVKKTALTYKEYSAKKDEHVENELERIKSHYKDIVNELQNKIQELVSKRQQVEITGMLNKLQANFNGAPDSTQL